MPIFLLGVSLGVIQQVNYSHVALLTNTGVALAYSFA